MALGSAETVSLAGMMGSGKSTVVDTDLEVERRAGRPVAAIFEERGEPAFRAIERAVVRGIAGPVVVSLGGGAFCDPGNAEHLIRIGRVVFLDVSPAAASRRLARGQARPLAGQWEELLRARLPMYRRAPITVDVDALSPDAVARRIAAILGSST
jgi:shikimate kinase